MSTFKIKKDVKGRVGRTNRVNSLSKVDTPEKKEVSLAPVIVMASVKNEKKVKLTTMSRFTIQKQKDDNLKAGVVETITDEEDENLISSLSVVDVSPEVEHIPLPKKEILPTFITNGNTGYYGGTKEVSKPYSQKAFDLGGNQGGVAFFHSNTKTYN